MTERQKRYRRQLRQQLGTSSDSSMIRTGNNPGNRDDIRRGAKEITSNTASVRNKNKDKDKPNKDKNKKQPMTEAVPPFMTGQDTMDYAAAYREYATTLGQLDYDLARSVGEQIRQRQEIDKQQATGTENANWDAASRGLFHSSIRDASLYDIDATAGIKRQFLEDSMNTMRLNSEYQKGVAQGAYDLFMQGLNQKMVENAQKVAPDIGKPPKQSGQGAGGQGGGSNQNHPQGQGSTNISTGNRGIGPAQVTGGRPGIQNNTINKPNKRNAIGTIKNTYG